jgi:hypothetical protein
MSDGGPILGKRLSAGRIALFGCGAVLLIGAAIERVGLLRGASLLPVLAPPALLLVAAVLTFPPRGAPGRRLMPLLALLALPPIASVALGPLGFLATSADPARQERLELIQNLCLAAAAVLPLLLLPAMRGGRRFTLAIGALFLGATFLIATISLFRIAPGS